MRLRQLALTIMILTAIVSSMVISGTFAHFVDSESSMNNVFETGSLDLLVDGKNDKGAYWGEGVDTIVNVSECEEDTIYVFEVPLWNTGSGIDGDVYLRIKNVVEGPDSAGFADDVEVRIEFRGQTSQDWQSIGLLEGQCLPIGLIADCESESLFFNIRALSSQSSGDGESCRSITFDLEFALIQEDWENNIAYEWNWDDGCENPFSGEPVYGGGFVDTETSEGNFFEVCCDGLSGTRGFWQAWDRHNTYPKEDIDAWLSNIDSTSDWLGDVDGDTDFDTDDLDIILAAGVGWGSTPETRFLAHYLAQRLDLESGRQDYNTEHYHQSIDRYEEAFAYLGLSNPSTGGEIVDATEDKYGTSPTNKQFEKMKDLHDGLNNLWL